MNVLESYLTNRKNQNEKFCRTAEKSSLEVGGPSLEIEKEKPLCIQLKGRAKVAQNMGTTMAEILDIIAYMIGWFKIE